MKADAYQVGGSHYKDMAIQPWEIMESVLTREEFLGYLKGNVIKYSLRQGRKRESDDADKAKHYMQKLREFAGDSVLPPNLRIYPELPVDVPGPVGFKP